MNLIVDIGNTLVKSAVMDNGRVVAQRCEECLSAALLDELFAAWPIDKAIVASTRCDGAQAAGMLRGRVKRVVVFTPLTPVPIANAYHTPETLGADRLAGAVGATVLYPGRNVLLVDFGTAITVDLVTADGTFRGGVISPGVNMRFRALHHCTASLPLCGPEDAPSPQSVPPQEPDAVLQGLSTREAIGLGVINSVAFEIEGYITRTGELFDDLCVIFTGGDAKIFDKRIKNTIFANWIPVFSGLDRILEYNAIEEHLD